MPEISTLAEAIREIRAGMNVPAIRALARRIGRNQPLAEQLWDTGLVTARILATFVADPATITEATMDKWAHESDSWGVCDACAFLFDRTPYAWKKIRQWAKDDRAFVRRAAF